MSRAYRSIRPLRDYDDLYTKLRFEEIFFEVHGQIILAPQCYYCGEIGYTKDHTFPTSAMERVMGTEFMPPANRLVIVPSCRECNGIISDRIFPTLRESKDFLKKRLRQKYKKLLSTPDWKDSELAQLKGRLRHYVMIKETKKEIIQRRIRF